MEIIREETFGPVLPIMPIRSIEEGIRRANDSRFGLTASGWTRSFSTAKRLQRELNAGVVMIDEPLYRELPEEVRRDLQRAGLPVVIPVPGPAWTTESSAHEYIVEILRRAIGYRVKLQ